MKFNIDPIDAAHNVLDNAYKALHQQIDDAYHSTVDRDYLTEPFQHSESWMLLEPYRSFTFEFEFFNGTFTQICNMIEMVGGKAYEDAFTKELTAQVKGHVESRITFYQEKEKQDAQRKLHFEHNRAVERREIA